MTDATEEGDGVAEPPFWLQATPDDLQDLDFEAPIEGCVSADCYLLRPAFSKASELHRKLGGDAAPSARVFAMLGAMTYLHFKPHDRNEPFGPIAVMDGWRSPCAGDFRGAPIEVLSEAALRAGHPVLKARLCDICWLLERDRHELGRAAITAYVDIVEGLGSGRFEDRTDQKHPMLGLASRDNLLRALQISRAFRESKESARAKGVLPDIRKQAIKAGEAGPIVRFFEMDLDFGVSSPGGLAAEIETYLEERVGDIASLAAIDLWRLAARAYHLARNQDAKNRCRIYAAEALASEAEKQPMAIMAASWMSDAIVEYRGVPQAKARRTELRHKLLDIQSGVPDELSTFSNSIDLKDIVDNANEQMIGEEKLINKLMKFADLSRSPDTENIRTAAIQSIKKHPLSSLFSSSFLDREGKVIHRSGGAGFSQHEHESSIHDEVAQREAMRRDIEVAGVCRVALRHIMERYYIDESVFRILLRNSPFVPRHLLNTYSRGFLRFFQGDQVGAIYTLTPILEESLRHVLKSHGFDVATFNDEKRTQQDRSISSLVDNMREEMESIFGRDVVDDIDRVFLSRPGPSIRHAVSHGLMSDGDPYRSDSFYACWLIYRLCCIPLFDIYEEIDLPS